MVFYYIEHQQYLCLEPQTFRNGHASHQSHNGRYGLAILRRPSIAIMGGYETCCQQCATMALAMPFPAKDMRVETRRGATAEELLVAGMRQEKKYQEECKAQPLN